MWIAARHGAASALIAVVTLAIAACLLQGTAISVATAEEGTGPQFLLSKPDGDGPFPACCFADHLITDFPDCFERLRPGFSA